MPPTGTATHASSRQPGRTLRNEIRCAMLVACRSQRPPRPRPSGVLSRRARRLYAPEAARAWLFGLNPHLGDRRPIDLVRAGRAEELLRAIRAERAESFA